MLVQELMYFKVKMLMLLLCRCLFWRLTEGSAIANRQAQGRSPPKKHHLAVSSDIKYRRNFSSHLPIMPSADSPALIVARYLKTNGYTEVSLPKDNRM